LEKKIFKVIVLIMIFITLGTGLCNADEAIPETEQVAQPEQTQPEETVTENQTSPQTENIKAKIIEAGESYERTNATGETETVQNVKVKILNGDKKDEKFDSVYTLTYDIDNKIVGYKLKEGNTVYVKISEEGGQTTVVVQDVVRQNYLLILVLFFFGSMILVGRKKGIKAIIGLVITVLAVFFVLLATIFKGYNAILVSVGTCFVIIAITFAIIGGWNKKTISAALGTLGGVVLSGVLATVIGYFAQLSGAGKEEAIMLSVASKNVVFNFRELLFAEIIVSALGACMDVGMSIASSLSELKMKKPDMNIGGDMIGTMSNTLILSFIGSSLVLILLYMASSVSFTDIINIEAIATEAVCAISGSVGIIYTVPITAAIFAFINRNKEVYKGKPENIIEGKRSLKL